MLDLSSLNPQQRLAVQTVDGPVLILAGAGTGKTRVITCRVAHLVAQGVARGQILGVTFTNKAAREMQERVGRLISKPARGKERDTERPTICTFHSLCVRILREHIERLGYKKNFVIFNESDQIGAIKKVLSHFSARGEKNDPRAILAFLSRQKNGGSQQAWTDEDLAGLALHVRTRYESTLRACNAVDFDDLLLLALRLFQEHPDVLESCRSRYRYVMVDEYQDTNAAQFRLVHLLTKEHRNLCVVGDDDQSIYGWRGAEIANLLDLEKHFPEVKVVKLEQNYRSTSTILSAANALIKNNSTRRVKQLWSRKGAGSKIALRTFQNDEEEARTLVQQIEYAHQIERVPWSDHAILFRTNIQSRPLETALRQAGVPYHLIGGQSFFDRREVKDLLAYLKFFLNPHDDVSLLRVANVPARGLSDATMQKLLAASQERKCSVYAAMGNPLVQMELAAATRQRLKSFTGLIERTRAPLLVPGPFSLKGWAEDWLAEIEYSAELKRAEKDKETVENRIRNLQEMVASLDDLQSAAVPAAERLAIFLDNLALDEDRSDEKEKSGDAVTLITVHSCKGLEFQRVFIVGLEDGLLPHSRSKAEGTLEEERRLFYVAITRAMLQLTLSYCLGRKRYGEMVPCYPSPFLKELPEELIEADDGQARQPATIEKGKSFFDNLRASLG
jgi:DNA helicase II / ATP-dependent DNA helicase PcrA